MKIVTDLERIGDQAVNIGAARDRAEPGAAAQAVHRPPAHGRSAPRPWSRRAWTPSWPATRSWRARVCAEDDEVDALKEQIFRELLTFMMEDPRTIPARHPADPDLPLHGARGRPCDQYRRDGDLSRRGQDGPPHVGVAAEPGMYTLSVSADRRYQLQSEEANRRIDALLEQLRVPASTWRLYGEMLTAVLKMLEDGAGVADLKIADRGAQGDAVRVQGLRALPARAQGDRVRLGAHLGGPRGVAPGVRVRQAHGGRRASW